MNTSNYETFYTLIMELLNYVIILLKNNCFEM